VNEQDAQHHCKTRLIVWWVLLYGCETWSHLNSDEGQIGGRGSLVPAEDVKDIIVWEVK